MAELPSWATEITSSELVDLFDSAFQKSYGMKMTKDARSILRKALSAELRDVADDMRYETGTSSPEEAAEKFAELAAGVLVLEHVEGVSPSPQMNSLERYTRVGYSATSQTIAKAKSYHARTKVCPVWPFCN